MPQVKLKRKPPELDMTPMVDLAFLLVTFFMLTTQFKTAEPVLVDTPASQSQTKLPDTDIMTITVSEAGVVFFSIDGQLNREVLLQKVGDQYQVEFSLQERRVFALSSSFGLPVSGLKAYLAMDKKERKRLIQPGIPFTDENNELERWIVLARVVNPQVRIVIRGDKQAPYPVVKRVIDILVNNNVTRFNLITDLEIEKEIE